MDLAKTQDDTTKLHIKVLQGKGITTGLPAFDERLTRRWRARQLVSLLVASRKPIKRKDLAEKLYDRKATKNDVNSVQVLICRIRGEMKAIAPTLPLCILNPGGGYQWNMNTVASFDVTTMQRLCAHILQCEHMNNECWSLIEELLSLCRTLPLEEYAAKKWAQPFRHTISSLYKKTISHALTLLWREEDYERLLIVCQSGLSVTPEQLLWKQDLEKAKALATPLAASPHGQANHDTVIENT